MPSPHPSSPSSSIATDAEASTRTATQDALGVLFHPRAIAVIGASDDTTKHGYIVLTNIRRAGFKGGIYGISRRLSEVDGTPC